MIKANFYPTITTNPVTESEFTDLLSQVATTERFPDAYYLGWIAPDNVPQALTPGRLTTTPNGDGTSTLHFTNDMPKNTNFSCGYLGLYVGIGTARLPISQLEYTDGAWVAPGKSGADWDFAFFNKCNVMKTGKYHFSFGFTWGAGETFDDVTSWIGVQAYAEDGGDALAKNLLGISDELARFGIGYNHYINLGRQHFTRDDGGFELDAEDGTHIIGYITSANAFDNRTSIRNTDNPAFFIDMPGHDSPCVMTGTQNYEDYADFTLNGLVSGAFDGSYLGLVGIQNDFEVNTADLAALSTLNTQIYLVPNCGYFVRTAYSPFRISFMKIYNISEIVKMFSLQMRITFTGADGYILHDIYAPYITEDNEFTATLITGNLENQEFKDKLRPWQYDITKWEENDFTEDDMPEYEPPEPPGDEPDEGDWGTSIMPGSGITFGTTAFSRFEMLDTAGVTEFLSKLWAAPQTFWEGLSINKQLAANLNDYILSFRAYPVNITGYNPHHVIYIGASQGLTLQQNVTTPELVSDVPLGTIRIPRQYHNFLDYNPYTSASIYLPFCGTCEINPKFLYDAELFLTLNIDCTDGSGVWSLFRWGDDDGKMYPILIRQCRVGVDIPITGLDSSQMASNIVNATLQTGQHALTAVNKITGAAAQVGATLATGGAIGAETAVNLTTMGGELVLQGLADATNMAMANKEIPFYTTGSSGAAASVANPEPHITLRRPLVSNPSTFAHTVGNLVNQSHRISTCSGYTVCRNVDTSTISKATANERAQIKKIMESGFYC